MQTSTEAPAHLIGDLWVVDQQLGSGGMGAVYRCHNKDAPRVIAAIKVLEPSLQHHPEARARFQREAELLATLRHPGVVRVFNAQLEANPPFIQMELVEGCALESLLMGGAIKTEVAHDLLRQLLNALSYLHGEGVYHRDLKPQNLLVADGRLKLIDFGLAAEPAGDRLTHHDARFGTISYCPPEWMNGATDPQAWDLYATGVIAYEMLTGTVAFPVSPEASAPQQMVKTMASKQELPFLDPGEHIPPALRTLVCALTARDPRARPATASAALRELGGWTPLSTFNTREMPKTRRAWPILAGLTLSFGALVALVVIVAVLFQLRPIASPKPPVFTLPPLQTIDVGTLESAARDETLRQGKLSRPLPRDLTVPPATALPTTPASPPPNVASQKIAPPRRRGLFNRKKTPQ